MTTKSDRGDDVDIGGRSFTTRWGFGGSAPSGAHQDHDELVVSQRGRRPRAPGFERNRLGRRANGAPEVDQAPARIERGLEVPLVAEGGAAVEIALREGALSQPLKQAAYLSYGRFELC